MRRYSSKFVKATSIEAVRDRVKIWPGGLTEVDGRLISLRGDNPEPVFEHGFDLLRTIEGDKRYAFNRGYGLLALHASGVIVCKFGFREKFDAPVLKPLLNRLPIHPVKEANQFIYPEVPLDSFDSSPEELEQAKLWVAEAVFKVVHGLVPTQSAPNLQPI